MLMLITLLNDGTLISVGYDNVKPSPRPGEATWPACPAGLLPAAPAVGACAGAGAQANGGCNRGERRRAMPQ